MIIFAVTTNVEFIKTPDWLNSFFDKRNKIKYEFHVTLKQSCIIQENQIITIQNIISEYISQKAPKHIEIDFNKLNAEAPEAELITGNACIMIEAENNNDIKKLQKEVVGTLSDFKDYLDPQKRYYEENFKPHITIASDLNKEEFELAKKDLKDDLLCQARITKIYLIVVRNFNPENKSGDRETMIFNLV